MTTVYHSSSLSSSSATNIHINQHNYDLGDRSSYASPEHREYNSMHFQRFSSTASREYSPEFSYQPHDDLMTSEMFTMGGHGLNLYHSPDFQHRAPTGSGSNLYGSHNNYLLSDNRMPYTDHSVAEVLHVMPGQPTPIELCTYDNKMPSGVIHITQSQQTVEFLRGVANLPV